MSIRPTLLDLAQRTDTEGNIVPVVEIMNEVSEVLDDQVVIEGNLPTGHKTTIRTGIPSPTWRKLYGGVQPTKSRTTQITDSCGMLEAYAEVDKALADLNGNTNEFRLSEDRPHIEGMMQEYVDTLFFGNETSEPEAFTGFSPRFNSLSGAANSENVINAGGSGSDMGSIWLIGWGESTCHGIVPKGSKAGLHMEDKGQVTIENIDGSNGRMEAYRSWYKLEAGLTVRDWRYVVRIANIDKSELTTTFTSGAFSSGAHLPELMFKAMRRIPNLSMCRPAFYMSRDMQTWVAQQCSAAVHQSSLTVEMVGGKMVESFQSIPLRRVDALAADEVALT